MHVPCPTPPDQLLLLLASCSSTFPCLHLLTVMVFMNVLLGSLNCYVTNGNRIVQGDNYTEYGRMVIVECFRRIAW